MYITSTINALTTSSSDIPVLLLSFNETRKLVARPKDYADLVQTTLTKFTLPHTSTLVFTTSTLDVCRGRDTEIDESAYALIAELLDEVTVGVVLVDGGEKEEVEQAGTSTGTGRRQEKGKAGEATPPPPHTTTHISHAIHDNMSTNPPVPPTQTHTTTHISHAIHGTTNANSLVPPTHPHTMTHISHGIHHPTKDVEQPPTPSHPSTTTTHISHGIHHNNTYDEPEPEPNSRRGVQEEEEEEEEDSNSSSVQPKVQIKAENPKGKAKPKFRAAQPTTTTTTTPKTLPQYAETPNPDPTPKLKPIIGALDEEKEDPIPSDLDWQFRDQGGNTSALEPPANPSTKRTSPQKLNSKVLGGRQSLAGRTLPMGSASSRSGPQSTTTTTTTQDDARFNVMITYEDQAAEFKTRGKHAVKKVLAGACRTFGIDFERARLVLLVDVGGEEHRFACGPEETMAQCGVLPNSKFVIELEEEVVDGEGEGDVDEGEVYELEEEEFA